MSQSTAQLRRQSDHALIAALVERSGGQLKVVGQFDQHTKQLRLRATLPTSQTNAYPNQTPAPLEFTISFPARYPFEAPSAKVDTPIFHPNVFTNATICLGAQWSISEGLDQFVARILRLLTYDPQLVNVHSAANATAARWYGQLLTQTPDVFPTISRAQAHWIYEPRLAPTDRKTIACPHCQQKIRLPALPATFTSGVITCPSCKADLSIDQNGNCVPS